MTNAPDSGLLRLRPGCFAIALWLLLPREALSEEETLMMRFPDIHGDTVVFSYGGDLWSAPVQGGQARLLTSGKGLEYFPKFSPDGRWIAFTGQYDGNFEVYVIPSSGGPPRQLTFYPSLERFDNQVLDWTPDGQYVVFRSLRDSPGWAGRFFKIGYQGGWPEPFPLSEGASLSFSPDGKKVAMSRVFREFEAWKRYKGGQAQDVWIYDFGEDSLSKVTDWVGVDHHPMWNQDQIYFVSDRTGVANLYRYDTKTAETRQVTDYRDWDIKWPGFGPEGIVFERGGRLYRLDFVGERVSPIPIQVPIVRRPEYVNAAKELESVSLSPNGRRIAVGARGELFVVAAKKGAARNLSRTAGVRERSVAWSPDGKWIAFLSDETGTEELYLTDPEGKGRVQLTRDSKWIIRDPVWSPDSTKIAFMDFGLDLYYVDVETKTRTRVDSSPQTFIRHYRWSPGSQWLTYTKFDQIEFASIYLYNLEQKKTYPLTGESNWDSEGVFDPEGRYLYFISRRDFRPALGRLEYNFTYNNMDRLYLATLRPDTPSPFMPGADEEPAVAGGAESPRPLPSQEISLDLEDLPSRVVAFPMTPGALSGLIAGTRALFYFKGSELERSPARTLYAYDLQKKKEVEVLGGLKFFSLSADAENLLLVTENSYRVVEAKPASMDPGEVKGWPELKLEALSEPVAEWRQMFREAWRWQRNLFFFEDMRGLDWAGILNKYLPLVDHLGDRHDLNYLMSEMIGEQEVGHLFARAADTPEVEPAKTGLLGAELAPDAEGYFRITKILKGENWNEDRRSPLSEPGVRAREGDYLLEVNGKPLRLPENPYRLLRGTLGTTVSLTLNRRPQLDGAWTVELEPIASEAPLRYLEWVERNRLMVTKATHGRVGYVHIPDMGPEGMNQFARMYYRQLDKEGLIVDERANGGGFLAEAILERLRRQPVGMNKCKSCGIWTYPMAAFSGRQVMLIDKYAGSDGDNFPYFYRKYGLGPIIGTRTWGGVIGGRRATLMDGGAVSAADNAVTNLEFNPEVENYGVAPDIEVDNLPNEAARGRDAQLEKAIEVILDLMRERPVKLPRVPR